MTTFEVIVELPTEAPVAEVRYGLLASEEGSTVATSVSPDEKLTWSTVPEGTTEEEKSVEAPTEILVETGVKLTVQEGVGMGVGVGGSGAGVEDPAQLSSLI